MGQPLGWCYSRTIIVIFFVFEFVNNIPIQFWVIVMKRLKLINQRVLVLPVFELPQSGILLVKFEIMPSY
jgi:hypothetical protein